MPGLSSARERAPPRGRDLAAASPDSPHARHDRAPGAARRNGRRRAAKGPAAASPDSLRAALAWRGSPTSKCRSAPPSGSSPWS
eukprot:CAMPEP_0202735514 /NCGR_PEP_ID=MMETSP1388-20130828/431_1 /ASSEMBLY_ACC=CAM_ASM_000864 /TAXON_ID=37098 /ORGANISM="Isochrysis sp, Strain CCMP1244" /LENGTH=83 /DNA_ID=CAMNT_0049401949 /DNA_START=270 /DNA_END=521 /DNA_ORIENTATION=-